jgi:hypothetical protein
MLGSALWRMSTILFSPLCLGSVRRSHQLDFQRELHHLHAVALTTDDVEETNSDAILEFFKVYTLLVVHSWILKRICRMLQWQSVMLQRQSVMPWRVPLAYGNKC